MRHRIVLNDAFKRFTLDQDKILPPEETVKNFRKRLKTLDLDILRRTVRIDNGRLGIPVYFSTCGRDAAAVIGTKKQMGKGATPQQAEASAVMELAERFSFFSFAQDPGNFSVDTHENVRETAIPFTMIAQSVHDESDDLPVARKLFEALPLKWTWGYNLSRQAEVLIPFDWFYAINEFNGPSAGNCVEEALSQGICEIVERHCSSIVSQERVKVPAIRPESATDPAVVDMLQKYRNAGVEIFISDFSLDLGIPSVGVLAYDPQTFPQLSEIVWTAGTTPNPQKALSRALTEVAQLAGDFNTGSNYVASGLPKFKRIEDAAFITDPGRQLDIQSLPDLSHANIRVEVQNCLSALAARGLEVLIINTVHPLLQIPAFYTIIPGAYFRERARNTSVALFAAKHVATTYPADEAIRQLTRFNHELPGKYYVQFYLGSCHLALGHLETATGYFRQALELEPGEEDIVSIYTYMAVAFKQQEKYREALQVLQRAKDVDPERTEIFNLMGFCHYKLKEHELAIEAFDRALELNPSSAIDYANLAANYRELGQKEKAVHLYELALALDPSIEFAQAGLARLKDEE
jgi:ribosomal protein S12 methylthiotransferase accessory factor